MWTKDSFKFLETINSGKFGIVKKCIEIKSNSLVAVKILSKEILKKENLILYLKREIEIHSRLKLFFF